MTIFHTNQTGKHRSLRAGLDGLLLCPLFLFLASCARMGTPDGGWYDDAPPRVLSSSPREGQTHVDGRRVVINFNEYIKLENAQEKVIVSPPQLEQPDIKAAGKRIVVDLKDSLKAATTYTIDFSDAITDNNEGNPMGSYTFAFSTGEQIDTFEVSGYALDAENLEPIKGILVGLYQTDSLVLTPMLRVSRTNGSGRFTIKGVAPGEYYVGALEDADGDFVYGQKSETVGYSHQLVSPTAKPDIRQDTIWRDSLRIDNILRTGYTHFLPDDIVLLCFKAAQTDRYLIKTERKDAERIDFYFSYGSDSLPRLRGLNFDADSAFVLEASARCDTLGYWLRDTALVQQDTLLVEATYLTTDSTGVLVEQTDTIEALAKTPYAKRQKELEREIERWQKQQERKQKRGEPFDSIMKPKALQLKLNARAQIDPDLLLTLEVPAPLADCDTSAVHLYCMIDSAWYRTPHVVEPLSTRLYAIRAQWQLGMEYSLEIDSAAFRSIYGLVSDPMKQGLKVRTADEYATLLVNLSGLSDTVQAVVQLLDSSDKVMRQARSDDHVAEFYYLRPGTYYMRAFADTNGDGLWDTGDYYQDRQPEPVYYYHEPLDCKAKWDLQRDWNLEARPRYEQKPKAITKQKPDKEKQLRNRNVQRAAEKGIPYIPKTPKQ